MNPGVSVVICCHNSAKRLPETLRHLAAQQVPGGIAWEVVVIDNASTDGTAETAASCWPTPAPAPLRVVTELRPGTGNARFRSFSEVRYEIISFVDDDNWVTPDWVSKVADFLRDHPEAAAVGGPSTAVFEAPPPDWFAKVSHFYAIGNQQAFDGDITDQPGTLLWTAGMSLRKGDVDKLIDKGFTFLSCVDSSFARGEDTELCFALRAGGGRLYYDSTMAIRHFMPAERIMWRKTLGLMHVMGTSSPIIDLYLMALNALPPDAAPAWKKSWVFQTLKALRHLAGTFLAHPKDCYFRTEGSVPALDFQKGLGRLSTLWALCGQYQKMMNQIRNASWARD